jgi:hypothetical protein
MKNFIIGFFLGGILGVVGGFAGGIFVFPFLFPPAPVNEVVDSQTSSEIVATGTFIHANPSDPVHYGKGRVSVYQNLLHLESDFEVGPGPKFHVYLVPEADITPETRVQDTMFVVIWCEQFNVLVSPAALKFTS